MGDSCGPPTFFRWRLFSCLRVSLCLFSCCQLVIHTTRRVQAAKAKASNSVYALALESVGYAEELAKSGTCQSPTIGVRFALVQAYVIPVVAQVGAVVKYVAAQGFWFIGCTL